MKAIKSIIKKIDRFIPFKETGITLLLTLTLLIIIEYIWDGSIARFFNMNHVIVAEIILVYLTIVTIIIKYIRRSIRINQIRQKNMRRLKTRMRDSANQYGRNTPSKTFIRIIPPLLLILPVILLSLIAVETIWKGSVSYYINLNYLIVITITTEIIAILAIIVIVGRQNLPKPTAKVEEKVYRVKPPLRSPKLTQRLGRDKEATAEEKFPSKALTRKSKWRLIVGIAICIAIFLGFSLNHLGRFETVDEPKWLHDGGRVDQLYTSIGNGNWSQTEINDKPGIVSAYLSGIFVATHNIADYNYKTVENYYFWSRFPIVIFNALALIFIYWLLNKLFNRFIAFISTLSISLSPAIIGYSQVVNPDATVWSLSFISILSFFCLLKYGGRKYLFLTGISLGLASLSKYSSSFIYYFLFVFAVFYFVSKYADTQKLKIDLRKSYFNIFIVWIVAIITVFALFPATWTNPALVIEKTIGYGRIQPLITIPLLLIADLFIFKSILVRLIHRYKRQISALISSAFLALILLTLIDIIGNYSVFNLTERLSLGSGNLNFFQWIFYNSDFFMLSLPLVIIIFLAIFLIRSYSKHEFSSIYISLMLIILFFLIGSASEDQGAATRYQLILFPIYLTLSAIGLYWIFRSIKRKMVRYTTLIIYVAFLVIPIIVAMPFYYTYTNPLNHKDYAINEAWGLGSYELAQEANELLPNGAIVWSDREGFNIFYKGPTYWRGLDNPFNPDLHIDYLVLTEGGHRIFMNALGKTGYLYAKVANNTSILDLYASNESVLTIYLNNNKNNYVRLIEIR